MEGTVGRPTLQFEERMSGYVSPPERGTSFEDAFERGRRANSSIQFETVITHDDLDRLLEDPTSPATIRGTVLAPSVSPEQLDIVEGTFVLLQPHPEDVETSWMRY
ncbi:MAG TPA: hypothetical protein VKR22_10760, partial [Acidimicrobiales bacterium]|nr:hypothetical protein [Acidimicrobiales bacterium]